MWAFYCEEFIENKMLVQKQNITSRIKLYIQKCILLSISNTQTLIVFCYKLHLIFACPCKIQITKYKQVVENIFLSTFNWNTAHPWKLQSRLKNKLVCLQGSRFSQGFGFTIQTFCQKQNKSQYTQTGLTSVLNS